MNSVKVEIYGSEYRIKGDAESPIKELIFRNLTIDGEHWAPLTDADIELSHVTEVRIK